MLIKTSSKTRTYFWDLSSIVDHGVGPYTLCKTLLTSTQEVFAGTILSK